MQDPMANVAPAANPPPPNDHQLDAADHATAPQPPAAAGEQGQALGLRYTCNHCGSRFDTPQRLGGHVAAHASERRSQGGNGNGNGVGVGVGAMPAEDKRPRRHTCKVCAREFDTVVALGDHMGKHYFRA